MDYSVLLEYHNYFSELGVQSEKDLTRDRI
jgi:hypothetical protein